MHVRLNVVVKTYLTSLQINNHDRGRPRDVRNPRMEAQVLQAFDDNPSTSTRAVARTLGRSHTSVWRVVHNDRQHPYHRQRVHHLLATDFPLRVEFSRWFSQRSVQDPVFPTTVLFTDEATFSREGMFNTHNQHEWAHDNPHATVTRGYQQRFSVNVWAGIVGDVLIGPYLLPPRLDGTTYLAFLQQVLPDLLDDVPLAIVRQMWFQHDGAPAHFALRVRVYLDEQYPQRWIGRGGPVAWPA